MGFGKVRKFKSTDMLKLSHKNLDVYRFSIQLLEEIYKTTKSFPKEEQYSRLSKREKKRFYEIARGSLVEIDTQLEISLILNYIDKEKQLLIHAILEPLFKMLSKMILNLNTPANNLNS